VTHKHKSLECNLHYSNEIIIGYLKKT